MQDERVTFETAKLAKSKGFDWLCTQAFEWYEYERKTFGPIAHEYSYRIDPREITEATLKLFQARPGLWERTCGPKTNHQLSQWLYARPTQTALCRWLRDVHLILVYTPEPMYLECDLEGWSAGALHKIKSAIDFIYPLQGIKCLNTYEQALELSLFEALKLLPDAATSAQ
jgi:hypothetical protein